MGAWGTGHHLSYALVHIDSYSLLPSSQSVHFTCPFHPPSSQRKRFVHDIFSRQICSSEKVQVGGPQRGNELVRDRLERAQNVIVLVGTP